MSDSFANFEMNHGIIAVNPKSGRVLHMCLYDEIPDMYAYLSLYKELQENPKMLYGDEPYILAPMPKELLDSYKDGELDDSIEATDFHGGSNSVN